MWDSFCQPSMVYILVNITHELLYIQPSLAWIATAHPQSTYSQLTMKTKCSELVYGTRLCSLLFAIINLYCELIVTHEVILIWRA